MTEVGNQTLAFESDLQLLGYSQHLFGLMDGVEWAICRHSMGHICGYVRVDGFPVNDCEMTIDCHGGVTYEGSGLPNYRVEGKWLGFDCAHAFDWVPHYQHGTYRNTGYVLQEIWKIIKQLKEKNHGKE